MLVIRLIGGLEIERDGTRLELPGSRRARALLAWLALHPGRHSRSRLAALFWPDALDASARASLRSAVWALRSRLGSAGAGYVSADRECVALAGDGLVVDEREFGRLLAHGRETEAVDLCRGQLLAGFDDDWVYEAREEHEARLAAALSVVARRAERNGSDADALVAIRRQLELRPLDEAACRTAMRLSAAGGDTAAALELYSRTRRRLRSELGCEPSAQTVDLAARIRGAAPPAEAREWSGTRGQRPLVGRRREIDALSEQWLAARAGHGSVVALGGEGGIGKTRLCEDLREFAERHDVFSVTAASDAPLGGPPFAVWSEALGQLLTAADSVIVGDVVSEVVGEAGVSGLSRLVPGARDGPAPRAPSANPRLERVRLFEETVRLIGRAACIKPLLIILEDLHQADSSSIDLVAYAGRRIGRLPVLLVLTRRRSPPRADLETALAALHARGALRLDLDLGPLPTDAVRRLVASIADLTAPTVERITAAAGGSPLIAVEAALACARGAEPAAGLAEAVHTAVYRLSRPAREFVELLAVAGRDVPHSDLLTLPLPVPERTEGEALGADLLRMRSGAIGFRHALLAEAAYQGIPAPDRVRLHETFAGLLSRCGGGSAGGRRAAEIAYHLRAAGKDEQAAVQLARAAADARSVAALPEAAAFLREAVTISTHDAELFVELAEVEAWRGLRDESDTAFARALELIAPNDNGALAGAWLRRGRWMRGCVCHPRESRRSYRNALDVLDREVDSDSDNAARSPHPLDPSVRAEALAGLAWAEAVLGSTDECEALLQQVAEALGPRQSPGDLLAHDIGVARAHALLQAGRFRESYAPLIAAAAAAGRAGYPDMAYTCLINAAGAAACAGEFDRALDFADRCLPLVEPNGLLRLCIYTHSARAAVLRRLARFAEADAACRDEACHAEKLGQTDLEGLAHHDRGQLELARGNVKSAATELSRALNLNAPVSRPLTRLCLAEALARAGALEPAEQELRAATLEPTHPGDFPTILAARASRVRALILAARGAPHPGRRRLAKADAEAETARHRRRDANPESAEHAGSAESGQRYVATLIDLGRPPLS